MVAEAVIDDDGHPCFSVDEVRGFDWELFESLMTQVQKVNGLADKIKDARKNSAGRAAN